MMKSDALLDYAIFQLSPKRSRCELFVSSDGNTEKLASGLLKPFVSHLKIAEEQVASASQTVKLELGRRKNAEAWFTKGTLERFVRFVSTPEVLELVNTYDAEMSQLEAARRIYSQGGGDQLPGVGGSSTSDDATKKELLRAIDVRLVAVQQDLSAAYGRATAAGFNIDSVSELQMFADKFGAHRLKDACSKFITLCERRPNLVNSRKAGTDDRAVRSSCGSDMSIDYDDSPTPPLCQESLHQSNPSSSTMPLHRSFSRESSVDREDSKKTSETIQEKDKTDDTSAPEQTEPSHSNKSGRRLSVQDRINMFENKQKENSGGKSVTVKSVELRRMSSDVSSAGADKAVLRRWSGASDMSIDLSNDRNDNESTLCTPSSSLISQESKVTYPNDDVTKTSSISKQEINAIPSSDSVSVGGLKESSYNTSESRKLKLDFVPGESDGSKDQMHGKTNTKVSYDLESFEDKLNNVLSGGNREGSEVKFGDGGKSKIPLSVGEYSEPRSQIDEIKDHGSSLKRDRPLRSKESGHFETLNRREDFPGVMPTRLKPTLTTVGEPLVSESVSGSRIREAFAAHCKGFEGDNSSNQKEVRTVQESEVGKESELQASGKASSVSVSSFEDSRSVKKKYPSSQVVSTDLGKNPKVRHDGSSLSANRKAPFPGQITTEAREGFDSFSTPPPEQSQRVRQSKGNQELHDELKMKANELEKLFAEHKLRVPGEQSYSSRKGKPENVVHEPAGSLHNYSTPVPDSQVPSDSFPSSEPTRVIKNNKTKLNNAAPLTNTSDSQNSGDALQKNFAELNVSEGSRGKLYDRYMQKRDAKLREDWNSNRAEKEARLKFMHDTLERSRSEMKDKFSGSLDIQDSVSSARRHAERLRSYNSRSIMKKEQLSLDFGDSEDDEEALDLLVTNVTQEDKALDDSSIMDSVSRGVRGKKHISSSKNISSSTPRSSFAPASKSAIRNPSVNSGKRRTLQAENPLAQSVPNFSDLRKENTKPHGGIKTTRSQPRNYSRTKNTSDEASLPKEENRSRRSQATRHSSTNTSENREIASDSCAVLTPIGFDDDIPEITNTKPFLKKGSRARYVSQANIAKQKISVEPEPINNMEENDEFASVADEITSAVKYEEEEEEFKISNADVHENLDNSETIRVDSDKFVHSESENGDGASSMFSRVDQALGTQLPGESFLAANSVQDWPVESPMSWASHAQHPFSYTHETSDVDAYAESPIGSVASWNSHSMNQIENDAANAARMRRKWGTAQKPTLITQSSGHSSSRKDVTRGFKRLLKFGRKNRASEGFVDWVSATTSEGDDDTEDGRDLPANRSSEDLRKSRMGYNAHGQQLSEDNFNESEFDIESVQSSHPVTSSNFKLREDHMAGSSMKAPRSFFSFMSKGSESKAR